MKKNVSPNPAEKMLSGQPGGPRMYPRSGYFLVFNIAIVRYYFFIINMLDIALKLINSGKVR